MNRKLIRLLIISCLLALFVGSLDSVAQEKQVGSGGDKKVGPGELKLPPDTFKVLESKFASGKVVKGAPYSATATTETIQTLSDGNQIIRKNQSKLYRDSEGRTRSEQTLETIGKWTTDGQAQQLIFINDPVAGFSYTLDSRTRTARKSGTGINLKDPANMDELIRLKQARAEKEEGEKSRMQKQKILEENQGKPQGKPLPGDVPPSEFPGKKMPPGKFPEPGNLKERFGADGRRKAESLGKQVIEGVEVEHTRTTLTIPAGEIGNTLPIEVIDETWYSHELQIMVMTKHRDPRSGETTYRLTNLKRSEPDRALFEVPAGYAVMDNSILPAKKKRPPGEE